MAIMASPDYYYWARDNGLYISQEALIELMNEGRVLICDTRDDDNLGGQISGAVHCPDSSFDSEAVACLAAARGSLTIVFHCMESARRGPRCAHRLFCHFNPDHHLLDSAPADQCVSISGIGGIPPKLDRDGQPKIRVLMGGADKWIRRFFRDPKKVEHFDDEYWGFLPRGDQVVPTEQVCCEPFGTNPQERRTAVSGQHILYNRPTEQPATPWSDAGSLKSSRPRAS